MAAANFYLRKMGKDSSGKDFPMKNMLVDFGFYIRELPFNLVCEAKDLDSNDFLDEDGEEEWFPGRIKMKAYTMDVTLISRGTKSQLYNRYKYFRDYLCGRDGCGTGIALYDDYHKVGRKDIRLVKMGHDAEYADARNGEFILSFKVTLKVNDPISEVDMSGGTLIVDGGADLILNGEIVNPDRIRVYGNTLYID